MSEPPHLGQRVSYAGVLCTVRYAGPVAGTTGSWLGVEWDDGTRGKHDGSHKGVRYFTCLCRSATAASFVRPSRPRDEPQAFMPALREKYLSEGGPAQDQSEPQIRISGTKIAEKVGFDKVWQKLAQVEQLRIVIVDGLRIASAKTDAGESIADSCPSVVHVDLSRNLFETIAPVVDICSELRSLRKLSINGNRFRDLLRDEALDRMRDAFVNVTELSLQETLLSWEELFAVAVRCPSLVAFDAGSNQLGPLPPLDYAGLSSTLTSLHLEFNDFTALSDLSSLTPLVSLRNLHLKGNSIAAVESRPGEAPAPVFPSSVQYLDLSYNDVAAWSFVDALATHFPGMTGLRLSHNPVYDTAGDDGGGRTASSSEESHMITIGRLANLRNLNFAPIKPADRSNADMFYLSRIARQLAAVPEAAEPTVLAQHPRYSQLCQLYGEPDVIRRDEINPSFLEARLIHVAFHAAGRRDEVTSRRIPKSFDIYTVRGIAGKLFGMSPLKLRLIWETGEWDPVAGYEDGDGDGESSDDDNEEEEQRQQGEKETSCGSEGNGGVDDGGNKSGRWIKREVLLRDGPKQLGYCVDGLDVRIRVEPF